MSSPKTYRNILPNIFKVLVLTFSLLLSLPSTAQFYNGMNTEFGKNRVQWKNPKWNYYRNDVFDVYFYGTDEMALYVQNYVAQQIPKMEEMFSSRFTRKIQFIIYNNENDLRHSNINFEEEDDGNTGGVVRIVGFKVILSYNGNYADMECKVRKGIAMLLINQITNGASVGSQIKSNYKYDMPAWYREGLCAYVAGEWNSYLEDKLCYGVTSGRYKMINQLLDEDARIAGYSFWRYIDENYGKNTFNDILRLSENARSVKRGLYYATGKKFTELTELWYNSVMQRYGNLATNNPSTTIKTHLPRKQTLTSVSISPDGDKKAYITNRDGIVNVFVQDITAEKCKRVFRTGFHSNQPIESTSTMLAWHPNATILSVINETKDGLVLINIDLETGKKATTSLFEFQKITAFSYSKTDPRLMVLAATRNGKPDIYVMNMFSHTITQITNDYYTDIDPIFSDNGQFIVFSSNRKGNELSTEGFVEQSNTFDLFSYNYANSDSLLVNLTNAKLSRNIKPLAAQNGNYMFLCDSSGCYNLFEASFDSTISHVDTTIHYRYFAVNHPVTSYTTSIVDYALNKKNGEVEILVCDNKKGGNMLCYAEINNHADVQLRPYATQRLDDDKEQCSDNQQLNATTRRLKPSYRYVAKKIIDSTDTEMTTLPTNNINQTTTIPNQKRQQLHNYYIELFSNKLLGQIDFSYLNFSYQPFSGGNSPIYLNSGLNVFLGAQLTDLFEDYRIDAGVKLNTSLINNEYILKISDLHKRLDKSFTFHRNVVDATDGYYYRRTFTNEGLFTLTYPFSEILALRGTAIYSNERNVFLSIDDRSLAEPDHYNNWAGLRAEFVLDDTRRLATNIYSGTRGKVFAEYYQLISRNTTNLAVVGFDVRDYRRLWRTLIWANRIAGSTSFGHDKLIYYMGGVDNWIVARFDNTTPIDTDMNFAYQTLATNMRGFKQNIRNGNSFILLNSELRFPVFACLLNRPINYEFIRNFQLIGFGDIGTAWTGLNPYDLSSALYTSHYNDGALDITVTKQKDPFVAGIGIGARTTIFGYFVRLDVAWGIEDQKINKKPQFYFSLNLDF